MDRRRQNVQGHTFPQGGGVTIGSSTEICPQCGDRMPAKEYQDHLLAHQFDEDEREQARRAQPRQQAHQHQTQRTQSYGQRPHQIQQQQYQNRMSIEEDEGHGFQEETIQQQPGGGITRIIRRQGPGGTQMISITTNGGSPGGFQMGFGDRGGMRMQQQMIGPDQFFSGNGMGGMGGFGGFGGMGLPGFLQLPQMVPFLMSGGFPGSHDPGTRPMARDEINQMPTTTYQGHSGTKQSGKSQESSNGDPDKQCTICITDYNKGDQIRTIRCLHKFHKDCIDHWLRLKGSCPICRVPCVPEGN